jgi:hypothetical protein
MHFEEKNVKLEDFCFNANLVFFIEVSTSQLNQKYLETSITADLMTVKVDFTINLKYP